ncbi:MAG: hypothetical protein IID15_01585 [Candidatus Marinimicrobia bacterium]|nr:hypothetical protein [Candidatus Neomarinimicrobiota bacterium]
MTKKDKELDAMSSIATALDQFDESETETVRRIVRWASERYKVIDTGIHDAFSGSIEDKGGSSGEVGFEEVGDMFHAANPKTESKKALVVGYWIIKGENKSDFSGQDVNKHLKDLGHGIGNITDAFNALMSQKPALAMQTSKSGKSKQARKKYKLTQPGLAEVQRMIGEKNFEVK